MREFLKKLGIDEIGYYKDKAYIIDLDNDTQFCKIYSKLEKSDLIEPDDDDYQAINLFEFNIKYYNEDYEITLSVNFENDTYKVIVEEVEK